MATANLNYANLDEMNAVLADIFYTDDSHAGMYVNGVPARNLEQIQDYLNGNKNERSRVRYFDGKEFHRVS